MYFTNTSQGAHFNVSIGFPFPYQSLAYSNVELHVNGFVRLNSLVTVSAYSSQFVTRGSESVVYYREVLGSSDLDIISSRIRAAYANFSTLSATNALVVTWFNVASAVNSSQLNTFQLILATDVGNNSFVIYSYGQLDTPSNATCQAFANSSLTSNFVIPLNCTTGGSLVQIVNIGGKYNCGAHHFWIYGFDAPKNLFTAL
jgi:hypothetical protein